MEDVKRTLGVERPSRRCRTAMRRWRPRSTRACRSIALRRTIRSRASLQRAGRAASRPPKQGQCWASWCGGPVSGAAAMKQPGVSHVAERAAASPPGRCPRRCRAEARSRGIDHARATRTLKAQDPPGLLDRVDLAVMESLSPEQPEGRDRHDGGAAAGRGEPGRQRRRAPQPGARHPARDARPRPARAAAGRPDRLRHPGQHATRRSTSSGAASSS